MKSVLFNKTYQSFNAWKNIPWGEHYCTALNKQLQLWWPKIFGFHLLKIGQFSLDIDTRSSLINHQFSMNMVGKNFQLLGNPNEMPFKNKSIDVCLLIQELAYSNRPYSLLRETDRILVDDGWLIISNLNPMSLLGIKNTIPFFRKSQLYRCDSPMFSLYILLDWLTLLNYEILLQETFQIIPWRSPYHFINKKFKFAGCIALVIARKRTLPLTPKPIKFIKNRIKISNILGVVKNCYKFYNIFFI
ncbi:methyltransferase domain-containing protein [Arsenophonus symbiont of Ornithomya chloropus]|uniref:methyltransferase domain-containing protein n=1 Tax=Arsenophonus symbiont of Ornithomya chloropus TaxID=634121 RepID=UPI0032B2FCD5